MLLKKFFEKNPKIFGVFFKRQYCPAKRGKHHQLSNEKGGENVEPNRREFIKADGCGAYDYCDYDMDGGSICVVDHCGIDQT